MQQRYSTEDIGNTFSRSWQLLSSNWIIIVPAIVIAIVAGLIIGVLTMMGVGSAVGLGSMGMGGAGVGAALLSGLLIMVVGLLATILTLAYTTGMAGAAWRTGTATIDDGTAAFRTDGPAILVAVVLLFALGIVAAGLSIFTFGLAMLAFLFFFIYTFASVIIGNRSGTDAISESARIAAGNFLTTLVIIVLLGIAFFIAGWIGGIFHNVRIIGPVISYVIQQIVTAYAVLVIVGEYMKLRGQGEPVAVAASTMAAPPPPASSYAPPPPPPEPPSSGSTPPPLP